MKPRIIYLDAIHIAVGDSATLLVEGHPKVAPGWISTSKVLSITPRAWNGPVIETLNTIYWPAPTDESDPYAKLRDALAPIVGEVA